MPGVILPWAMSVSRRAASTDSVLRPQFRAWSGLGMPAGNGSSASAFVVYCAFRSVSSWADILGASRVYLRWSGGCKTLPTATK